MTATQRKILRDLSEEGVRTVLVVTHERDISSLVDRTVELADGAILRQEVAR